MEVDLSTLEPRPEECETTAALVRGVAARAAELGFAPTGFDAYAVSDVLPGSGLSSSAACEVLLGNIVNTLFCGGALSPVAIAQMGQYAENVYFGKPSGLMDQTASSVGGAVAIDFADPAAPVVEPRTVDLAAQGYALCIVDSGADHADLTAEYAAIPAEMKAVAAFFGREVLREVSEEAFFARLPDLRGTVGDRAVLRALHFFEDDKRVERKTAALAAGDSDQFLPSGECVRPLLLDVSPEHRPRRGGAGAGDGRGSGCRRAGPGRPGGLPGPWRRLRRDHPGFCASGPSGPLPGADGVRAGRGLLSCPLHPPGGGAVVWQ